MLIDTFKHEFKKKAGVFLTNNVILFRRPLELYDFSTDTTIEVFKGRDVEVVLDREIEGVVIRDIISRWRKMPMVVLHGGRGGGSDADNPFSSKGIPSAGGGKGAYNDKPDLPARFNAKMGATASFEQTLELFRNAHVNDDYESGITVDAQGFVTSYVHGASGSVGIAAYNGEHVIHNHPVGGYPQFSKEDLVATALENSSGITASSTKAGRSADTAKYAGDYIFTKSHNFNAQAFIKAVNTARIKGKDYNDAVDKWLRANQKKYGYTYTFKPDTGKYTVNEHGVHVKSGAKASTKSTAPKISEPTQQYVQLSFFD